MYEMKQQTLTEKNDEEDDDQKKYNNEKIRLGFFCKLFKAEFVTETLDRMQNSIVLFIGSIIILMVDQVFELLSIFVVMINVTVDVNKIVIIVVVGFIFACLTGGAVFYDQFKPIVEHTAAIRPKTPRRDFAARQGST